MRNLLEQLSHELTNYVHLHREAPAIRLTRTGAGQTTITAKLTDVGSDFIEVTGFRDDSPVLKVSRNQIADIAILPKGDKA